MSSGATSQTSTDEAAVAFPPLLGSSVKSAAHAGKQSWEGSPTSSSDVDGCVASEEISEEQLLNEIDKLNHELEVTRRKELSHRSNAAKLRNDITRCSVEAAAAAKEETRLLGEANAARFRGGGHREALRTHNEDIQEKLADFARRAAEHEQRQRAWREELESMSRQQANAADHVDELQRANDSLKAAAIQQNSCLAKAEARVKRLEVRRTELKTEAQKLQQQLKMQLEGKCYDSSRDEASSVVQSTRKSGSAKAPRPSKGGNHKKYATAVDLDLDAAGAFASTGSMPWFMEFIGQSAFSNYAMVGASALVVALAYMLLPQFTAEGV